MPALAIVTLPCSITSWMAVLSMSDILSNSSMHTTPLSANTMAPASSLNTTRYLTLTLWSQKFTYIISTLSVPITLETISSTKTSQGKAVTGQQSLYIMRSTRNTWHTVWAQRKVFNSASLTIYEGHSESKEHLHIQPAQLFHCTRSVIWCVQ